MFDERWMVRLRHLAVVAFAVAVVAVVFLSVTPRPLPTSGPLLSDKVQHLAAYAVLAVLGGFGFAAGRRIGRVALALFALGVAMEIVQSFVPGRFAGLDDVVANSTGILIGCGLALIVNRGFSRWVHTP